MDWILSAISIALNLIIQIVALTWFLSRLQGKIDLITQQMGFHNERIVEAKESYASLEKRVSTLERGYVDVSGRLHDLSRRHDADGGRPRRRSGV